jgi:hypothetical protein
MSIRGMDGVGGIAPTRAGSVIIGIALGVFIRRAVCCD